MIRLWKFFSVMYVNDDFHEEDDLLSVHSVNEEDDSISLVSVVKVKPNSLADYAGYRKGDEFVNVIRAPLLSEFCLFR